VRIPELRGGEMSRNGIATLLNREGVPTAAGGTAVRDDHDSGLAS